MRLLILAPHFPPSNAADAQRVRMYLPYWAALGWSITVLCVDAEDVDAPIEPALADGIPAAVQVIRVRAPLTQVGRLLRRRSLAWRALAPLRRAGNTLLRAQAYDLLYVSTTQFGVARLALEWQRRFGLRYGFDLQDPWVSDHHRHSGEPPPGGHLRYALAQRQARRWEPRVLGGAALITAVSADYLDTLAQRYPPWPRTRGLHLPFGVEPEDFLRATTTPAAPLLFVPDPALEHWVYVGRGGADLVPAWRVLFEALATWRAQDPAAAARIRIHLIGTSYTRPARAELAELAQHLGVAAWVQEWPERIPYLHALRHLQAATALILPASTDTAYQPSKLHLCVLAHKPLLVLARPDTTLWRQTEGLAPITRVALTASPQTDRQQVLQHWLHDAQARHAIPNAPTWIAAHTAGAAAARLAKCLQRVVEGKDPAAAEAHS